jgi:hypothetical protein
MPELPPDPDEADLPPNLGLALDVHGDAPAFMADPATGERTPITRADLAAAFADARRMREDN